MATTNRVEPYQALADVYQRAGFAAYGEALIPALYNVLFEMDWTGRTVLDLAAGTGEVAYWLAEHGLRVTAVDSSPAMVRRARTTTSSMNLSVEYNVADVRAFRPTVTYDLALSLGSSLNYIPSLRDLEGIFRMVYAALEPKKYFIFDLMTIRGLAAAGNGDRVVSDDEGAHLILSRNQFSYETLTLTTRYTIFAGDATAWQRFDEVHLLRGYPFQAITRLLEAAGLSLVRLLTTTLEPVDDARNLEQIIIIAQKGE
ncbi:MAG: class I SAM-dependent methyltransferase [Anaerolineae bacterium]|nr:class I SAM-dependent methyltransferase [Anaerolineae bacterium]